MAADDGPGERLVLVDGPTSSSFGLGFKGSRLSLWTRNYRCLSSADSKYGLLAISPFQFPLPRSTDQNPQARALLPFFPIRKSTFTFTSTNPPHRSTSGPPRLHPIPESEVRAVLLRLLPLYFKGMQDLLFLTCSAATQGGKASVFDLLRCLCKKLFRRSQG
ncbi:uncharacterized protein [Gossypium hirsutum]|uniref:Uncharacterized protein n=1 Tax=Gossypium hirsutum TaxID=3635 RepID=A0ABM3A9K5_GOSHI|nr:uncharacterized protein LOC121218428 [Gossypium hirsutum]